MRTWHVYTASSMQFHCVWLSKVILISCRNRYWCSSSTSDNEADWCNVCRQDQPTQVCECCGPWYVHKILRVGVPFEVACVFRPGVNYSELYDIKLQIHCHFHNYNPHYFCWIKTELLSYCNDLHSNKLEWTTCIWFPKIHRKVVFNRHLATIHWKVVFNWLFDK